MEKEVRFKVNGNFFNQIKDRKNELNFSTITGYIVELLKSDIRKKVLK